MKRQDKATRILAKLVEVGHWVASVDLIVIFALTFFMGEDLVQRFFADHGMKFSVYLLEYTLTGQSAEVGFVSLRLTLLVGAVLMALMAMVFRNIYLIMKNSENGTPFQKDNVRMVREIGIFLIVQPILSLVLSWVIRLVAGSNMVEVSVGLDSAIVGLVVLCLSQFFARGVELEADTEGLL